jgi:hypothetical protein
MAIGHLLRSAGTKRRVPGHGLRRSLSASIISVEPLRVLIPLEDEWVGLFVRGLLDRTLEYGRLFV